MTNEELERRRRSYAMLTPGQPAMSREEAIELVEELQRCRYRGRQLLDALRDGAVMSIVPSGRSSPAPFAKRAPLLTQSS